MNQLKIILCYISLVIFASCGKDNSTTADPGNNRPGQGGSDKLIIMSYNIRHCAPFYGTSETTTPNVNNIADIIKSKKPDIVFLQEVDKCTTRSLGVDQAKKIAELAGYPFYQFFKGMDYRGGEFGLAILSTISLQNPYTHKFPKEIDGVVMTGESSVGTAKIRRNEKDITIAVAHLSVNQIERDKQMAYVIDKILTNQTAPIIFAGDFNATPTNSTITILNNAGYTRTNKDAKNYTIPSNAPNREIDYISYFPLSAFTVTSNFVLTGLNASDHLPIISIIKIEK